MRLYPITIPGGSDTHVQYNNGGIFGGDSTFTLNDTTKIVTMSGAVLNGTQTYGIDLSSGTWSSAVMNWDTDPEIYANGTQIINFDDANNNLWFGTTAGNGATSDTTFNVGIGYQAGYNLGFSAGDEGKYNVYMGYQAGYGSGGAGTQKGIANFGLGYQALYSVTSSTNSVAIGSHALYSATTARWCFALGTNALEDCVDADKNTAIGYASHRKLVGGMENTSIGYNTGYYCGQGLGGDFNVNIGNDAGAGQNNLSTYTKCVNIGYQAGTVMTSAQNGVIIGAQAGPNISSADSFVLIGYRAGRLITSTDDNVMVGAFSGYTGSTQDSCTFLGYNTGYTNTTNGCVFIGANAGYYQDTADRLIIDNRKQASAAAEITNALMYGIFDATPASQNLRINGSLSVMEKSGMTTIGGFAVKLTNTTGAATVQGQTVKADPTTDDAVILTAADDTECIGVFLEAGIADDAEAWVVIAGIADVAMGDNEAATAGNWVETNSAEAGYADATSASPVAAPQHFNEIGHCIETVGATGGGTHILARCVLHFN